MKVLAIAAMYRKGYTVKDLSEKTGVSELRLHNFLYEQKRQYSLGEILITVSKALNITTDELLIEGSDLVLDALIAANKYNTTIYWSYDITEPGFGKTTTNIPFICLPRTITIDDIVSIKIILSLYFLHKKDYIRLDEKDLNYILNAIAMMKESKKDKEAVPS